MCWKRLLTIGWREILFAQEVRRQCYEEGYASIINDGSIELDELVDKVVVHFGLGDQYGKKEKRTYCV